MAAYAANLGSVLNLATLEGFLNDDLPVKVTTFSNTANVSTTGITYVTQANNGITVSADEALVVAQIVQTSHSTGAAFVICSLDLDGTDYVETRNADAFTSTTASTTQTTAVWAWTGLSAGAHNIITKIKLHAASGTAYCWHSYIIALQFKYR